MSPPEPHRGPFARALLALHLVGLSLFLAVALAGLSRGAEGAADGALVYGALLAATVLVAGASARPGPIPPWLRHLHLGWAVAVLPVVFDGIRHLVPSVTGLSLPLPPPPLPPGRHFDGALAALDRGWFGVDVARWSEGFLTPPVADVFMLFYALYFLMPAAALVAFLARRGAAAAYRPLFVVALGLWACYSLYILVPAAGPRHAYVNLSAPLPGGLWTRWFHDAIVNLEPQPFDAFPSAHVVMGILCAVLAWPLGGWFRWAMAVVGAGTAVSTVVLRYHYVIDDVVGLAIVALSLAAAWGIDRRAAARAAPPHGDRVGDLLTDGS